jgi:hypothetical protein
MQLGPGQVPFDPKTITRPKQEVLGSKVCKYRVDIYYFLHILNIVDR